MTAVYGIILLIVPMILIALAQRFYWLDKIGVVILAFVSGLLFSVGYQPTDASLSNELLAVKTQVSEVAIAVAIPLLLFSINIPVSIRLAGSAVKAMLLACLGMCLATLVTSLIFQQQVTHIWQAAGMMVGAYTGGGQNIGAVKAAINADPSLFVDMLTYDIIISALYLLSAMTILKPIASSFLPPFLETAKHQQNQTTLKKSHSQQINAKHTDTSADDFDHLTEDGASMFTALTHRSTLAKLIIALLLAAACIGLSLAVSELFTSPMQSAITIICLTTLGAALSFIPSIRKLTLSYPLGMFFIIVFCFASGSMADLSVVTEIKWGLFGYISSSLLLAIVFHGLLCKLFKVDADTFVITGSAAIMSVPFIPMIASSINNKALLFPGIAAGVMGYVLGNYLGIAMAYLVLGML